MKKIILILGLIFVAFLGFSQDEGENINIDNAKLNNRLYGDKSGGIDTLIVPDTDSLGQYKYMNMLNPANDLDGVNRRTLSDTISKYAFVEPRNSILFNIAFVPVLTQQGTIWWNGAEYTLNIETGLGPTIQVGQETLLLYYNDTGFDIPNFSVLHPKSATFVGGIVVPTPDLASASTWELSEGTLSVATQLIPNGQLGFAVRFGRARDGNTSAWAAGSQLWLSTTPGEITDTKPIFPDYAISLGGSLNQESAPDGEIFVSITKSIEDTYNDAWDGSVRETFNFTTSSNGTVITGILENADNTRNLTLLFSDGFYTLDVTPADTIILTAGTDEVTQTNYVYIPIATKVLTLSTSGFPATEHNRIATLEVQSALNVQSVGGARGNQNHNDHLKLEDDNGHVLHITAWIRRQFATWGGVGCEATFDATAGNGYVSTTAGKVSQLHLQDVPALSMPTVDIMIANDPTTLFRETDNLNTITEFSDGSAWNNKWGKIVVWLIANKTGEPNFLCVNLPRAGENSSTLAINDEAGFADYSIPTKYKSNAILVGAFAINVNSGVVTYSADSQDLRGTIPSNIAGGVGAGGVSSFLALTDTDPSFTAFAFQRANAGATALENVLASAIDIGDFNDDGTYMDNATHNAAALTSQYVGLTDIQTLTNKTLTTPTIADFTNATHDHSTNSNGGLVDYSDLTNTPDLSVYVPYTGATTNVDLGSNNITAAAGSFTSASFPVIDVKRNTGASGGNIFGAASFERLTTSPSSDGGIGVFFKYPNSSSVSTFAGMFGGRLSTTTASSEIGEIVFAASYHGTDPSAKEHLVITAVSADGGDVSIPNGDLTVSGTAAIGDGVLGGEAMTRTQIEALAVSTFTNDANYITTSDIMTDGGTVVYPTNNENIRVGDGSDTGDKELLLQRGTLADGFIDTRFLNSGGDFSIATGQTSTWTERFGIDGLTGISTFSFDAIVPAEVYGVGWNGSNEIPTKNDLYDKIETLGAGLWQSVTNGIAPTTISDVVYIGSTTGTGGGTYELDVDGRAIFSGQLVVSDNIVSDYNIIQERASIPTPGVALGNLWMDSADDKLYWTNSTTTYDLTAGGTPTRQTLLTNDATLDFTTASGTWAEIDGIQQNTTLTFTVAPDFTEGLLRVTQDGTGGWGLTIAESVTAITSIQYSGGLKIINPDPTSTTRVKYKVDEYILYIDIIYGEE